MINKINKIKKKQTKKFKRTEKAWVDKHYPNSKPLPCIREPERKHTFLDFTRFTRWYTIDARSRILSRLNIRKDRYYYGRMKEREKDHYPRWPRLVV